MTPRSLPQKQGLYDPRYEHDACGVGFVVHLKNRRSHAIVRDALQVLLNLEHRGACGCEKNTGDGAGILLQMPDAFLRRECAKLGIELPQSGQYGVGMVFLPTDESGRQICERAFERVVREEGQTVLGWRDVPVDPSPLGNTAREAMPIIRQIFIGRGGRAGGVSPLSSEQQLGIQQGAYAPRSADDLAFERKLYVIRRRIEHLLKPSPFGPDSSEEFFTRWEADVQREVEAMYAGHRVMFYVPSLSCKTIVYKGMLNAGQLPVFYPDLNDPALESALAMVHSRFSTNTFPTWARSHPYRYISHNGEINTLRGNVNWMTARERMFASPLFGDDIKKILPVIDQSGSDSAMFDNALELLVLGGRSLPHAVMMMIPEPWSGDEGMSPEKKAFYEYHSCLMEPWDGPASIAFTDGIRIGAVLDRNGLRPSRYYVTKDDRVIMASEVGVLDVPPETVVHKGRLRPGHMFLVDMEQGRIIADEELKEGIATEHRYGDWLRDNLVSLEQLPPGPRVHEPDHETVRLRQRVFGYTTEDLRIIMAPMAQNGNEAIGSMGNDAALAVLSDKPQLLYNYFKQLFAQVTNPPVDGIREELIMSMETSIGSEYNLLEPEPRSARQIKLKSPILKNDELDKLRQLDSAWRAGSRERPESRGAHATPLAIN